jgi:hypothetical protein
MLATGYELSERFVLIRRLGVGGSGEVWLAVDRERGADVALKILGDRWFTDSEAKAALAEEAKRASLLQHPNILRVERCYGSPEHMWIAMEFAPGGDLSQFRQGAVRKIISLLLPVARGLEYAHARGVIHRDMKPSNVLLSADGRPLIADFGVSRWQGEEGGANAGRGSPFSMSPQQRAGREASIADDIYGFGALLYELLSGYPPYYFQGYIHGSGGQEAAGKRMALAPLSNHEWIPDSIRGLIETCLQESSNARPATMAQIVGSLENALEEIATRPHLPVKAAMSMNPELQPPSSRPTGLDEEPLKPQWHRPGDEAPDDTSRKQRLRRGVLVVVGLIGVAALASVFAILPGYIAEREAAARPKRPALAQPAPNPAPAPEEKIDFEKLAEQKAVAEEKRKSVDDRLQALVARAAEQWDAAAVEQARTELTAADELYAKREYEGAVTRLDAVVPRLDALEKRASEVLEAKLGEGAQALLDGNSAVAKAAFELASKLDPKNKAATVGLKRSESLDAVFALVREAERLEKDGATPAAAEKFTAAVTRDGDMVRAKEGLARVQGKISNDIFAQTMARGYSALAARDYVGARNAFNEASRLRPQAPEIGPALRQIEQEQKTQSIAGKLASAREAEAKEQWGAALARYREILEADATVAFAIEGVARTEPRAKLNDELALYVTQPQRLYAPAVRDAARRTLERARATPSPGPVLRNQIAVVAESLAAADKPVAIALESDNQTQVTIYKVGNMGAFERRSLELVPGKYTAVGTREGYRDVRREIIVTPGQVASPVVIRCEDKI